MFTKFIRIVALVAIIITIVGNSGAAQAASQHQPAGRATFSPLAASALGVQFVQFVTTENLDGTNTQTILDHPFINSDPTAVVIVTPNWNPGAVGGAYHDKAIGVSYATGKWGIFNEDGSTMSTGRAFNVLIPKPGSNVFVHTATTSNIVLHRTIIDNPATNGNPNARLLVTQRYQNASGSCPCAYNNNPIGVFYNGSKWEIFNQNIASMPANASFNVFVLPTYTGAFVHTATSPTANETVIDNPLTDNNPNAIVFATPNYNPGGGSGTYNSHNIGVYYGVGKWKIFNQDGAMMPVSASFNVLVLAPQSDIVVHRATAGNINNQVTYIDHFLSNSDPNGIVFTTPNWNPGGTITGTYNNHNIGVFYAGPFGTARWAIFNQDVATMPVNAAFNVLIPHPDTSVFLHKATATNTIVNTTDINYPLTNNDPNAIVFVTPNWNPGGTNTGTYNDHPIGVSYDIVGQRWSIFNQDGAAMPDGAWFNVMVPDIVPGIDIFVHHATVGVNTFANYTLLDNPLSNNNPNALVIVTANYNPGGSFLGISNPHPIGVYYHTAYNKWAIFNQDLANMPDQAAFNVYVDANRKVYLPLVTR